MGVCSHICVTAVVITTIPIYIFLAIFWTKVNKHWSHIWYYGAGVLNCGILLIGAFLKHRHVLGVYLIADGLRLCLQICLFVFATIRAIKKPHEDIEDIFGTNGMYRALEQNFEQKDQDLLKNQIDQFAGYALVVLAVFSFLDIIATLTRLALGHHIRKSAVKGYGGLRH